MRGGGFVSNTLAQLKSAQLESAQLEYERQEEG
jgi:hypothetical protein